MTAQPSEDWYEADRRATLARIDRYGYTAIVVGSGECAVPGCTCTGVPDRYPYAYSLGLCRYDHPELVVFGLPLGAVNAVMNPVHAAAAAGTPLAVGREHHHRVPAGGAFALVPVPPKWVTCDPGRIGGWFGIYSDRSEMPEFLQIVWADRSGAFPWDSACSPEVSARQPLLSDNPYRYPRPPRPVGNHPKRPRRRR